MTSSPVVPRTRRRFWLIPVILLARLRFLFLLGLIGTVIVRWEEIISYYQKWTHSTEAKDSASADTEYFCPMHPTVIREDNREKCPICFMPLSKRKKGEVSDEALPAGVVSRVQLSPYRVVLAGARTIPVEYQLLTKELTTVGTLEFDERNLRTVSARVKGRIEKLFVNQTGQMVNKGESLAIVYSPDLAVSFQNLLDARTAKNTSLEQDSRERLRLWGVDDKEIDLAVKEGKPVTQLTIRSPISGHVLKKYPREGQYVEEGGHCSMSPIFRQCGFRHNFTRMILPSSRCDLTILRRDSRRRRFPFPL